MSDRPPKRRAGSKKRLRELINSLAFPIHCGGCDEWGCGGVKGSGAVHEIDEKELSRLWDEIKTWRTPDA